LSLHPKVHRNGFMPRHKPESKSCSPVCARVFTEFSFDRLLSREDFVVVGLLVQELNWNFFKVKFDD
jgi:hypothetical protein